MQIKLNRITNANIYFNGNSLLGRAEEIKLPDISAMMTEHKAVGMVGKIELPSGFDKLEGEIKWNSFYPEVAPDLSNPFSTVQLQCRANVEEYTSQGRTTQKALVTFLTVSFKKNPAGAFKQHDNAEFSSSYACYYIRQQLDGEDILEFDPMANIYKIKGVDQLELYRANLGG